MTGDATPPRAAEGSDIPTDRAGIVARLAACGLDCGRCLSHPGSPISRHARALLAELGNFAARAAFFARLDPVFENYEAFAAVATRFAAADCAGCRSGKCLLGNCAVQRCVKERSVDFCCECPEFPCDHTGFSGMLYERWLANNRAIRELGLAAFMQRVAGQARY